MAKRLWIDGGEEIMAEDITCLLCGKVYEKTDAEIQSHFNQQHSPITEGLMHYVIELQRKVEILEKEKV
jgi:hypothetical protein